MAKSKSHKADGQYTNPEVRFERHDIAPASVLNFAIVLTVVIAVASAIATWLALALTRAENKIKETSLPPAAVDKDFLPPQPRLEALEDLREKKKAELFPPRAKAYLTGQEQLLLRGKPAAGVEPISEAITQLAGRLPARKQPAPEAFGVMLPSKASSGRVDTGGQ